MRKTRPFLYVLLPLFYVGIAFGLVVFQFSKNDSFSQSLGDLSVTGKAPSSGTSQEVLDVQIRGRGLNFSFSATKPVLILSEDGTSHSARPVSWVLKDGVVRIDFQYGFQLLFRKTGAKERSLVIQTVIPPSLENVTRIEIPFGPESGATFKRDPRLPLLTISKGNVRMLASLDGGQDRISDDPTFQLSVQGGRSRSVRVDPIPEKVDPISFWLVQGGTPRTEDELGAALKDYWNKAYETWSTTRYRSDSAAWDMGDGTVRFSQTLVAAYLTESLARGDYSRAYQKVSPGISLYQTAWNYNAMPYLGNLMDSYQSYRAQFDSLASKDQIDWAGRLHLWKESRFYGPDGLAGRLLKILMTSEIPAPLSARLAYVSNLLDAKEAAVKEESLDTRLNLVLQECLTSILRKENDLFMLTKEGWLDLRSNVTLGKLLLRYSDLESNPNYKSVGVQLILSALGKQDKLAQIPEILVMDQDSISRQEGTIRPEELYALLKGPTLEEIPVSWSSGSSGGGFVKTPAQLIKQNITAQSAQFTFQFPTGGMEHIVIQGVPPFDHILLHGIRWRTDPQFQSYSDGWYYSASTQTLFVKIKHRQDVEDLVINY